MLEKTHITRTNEGHAHDVSSSGGLGCPSARASSELERPETGMFSYSSAKKNFPMSVRHKVSLK